ncbi:MAG: aminotransferase class V-fold PLP-dependent enzyme [Bryobacterales bacterium]|nr:aminotransferase class V-fold PLP-dependent enzyme [Bryobacterales bacterium]
MGFDNSSAPGTDAGLPLSVKWSHEFPITERLIYLNHAAVAPLSRSCAESMKRLADDALFNGSLHYDQWLECYEGFRISAARLIGGSRDEIAIVKNTSEGVSIVALGLDWKPGDKIVAFREEFPANYFPWLRLEERGVRIEWLSVYDSPDRIEEAARGAKLLAISFVQYLSGYRADIQTIGEICHRHGCFFFVDAIQGLGVFPLDVRRCHINALAADGHKWLLGPEGCGLLFVDREWQDRIEPVEFGWTNIAGYNDYSCRDMTLRPDAGRYECGTLNTISIFGLRTAIDLALEIGIARIGPAVLAAADRLAEGAVAKGYEILCPRTPETRSGIVSIRKPDLDARMVLGELRRNGVTAALRQGWTRLSPHFYVGAPEIEKIVDLLP